MPRDIALDHFTKGLASCLGLQPDDKHLMALAVCFLDVAQGAYEVVTAGYGSFTVEVKGHWLAGTATDYTNIPDLENRKPVGYMSR